MPDGQFSHIIVRGASRAERFARPGTGGSRRFPARVPDREGHARLLLERLHTTQERASTDLAQRSNFLTQAQNGIYLTVESREAEPLLSERLERPKKRIELLNVREVEGRTSATVFVPETAKDFFYRAIEDYRTKDEPRAKEPEPKGRRLIEGIGDLHLATLRDLWIEPTEQFPALAQVVDWEVWLRPSASDRFRAAALELGVAFGAHPLVFPEDVAIFVRSSADVLARLNELTVSISGLAHAKRMSEFLIATAPEQQALAMEALLQRLTVPDTENRLCILDTGINRAHRLLTPLVQEADCHAYRDSWGADDHHGHGTAMAGVCAYGDLASAISNGQPISVPYQIESVKVFPPVGQNLTNYWVRSRRAALRRPNFSSPIESECSASLLPLMKTRLTGAPQLPGRLNWISYAQGLK